MSCGVVQDIKSYKNTYTDISPKMVNPRDIARNAEEEGLLKKKKKKKRFGLSYTIKTTELLKKKQTHMYYFF